MQNIAIVGGSGFVGSRLISELDLDHCQNFDKNPSPFFNNITTIGDIRFPDQIKLPKEVKIVVLLAAEHKDDISPVSLYYDVNVKGTKNILDKMDSLDIKHLIFTSSVAIYGLNKKNPDENHLEDPFNHYGKSKWEAEQIIRAWYDNDPKNKSVTILRPTVIFGERNRGNVYNLLRQIASKKFLMIGNGENKKSMAYVANVVAFIKHRIEKKEKGYQVFNYVDQPDLTMNSLIEVIQRSLKIEVPSIKIPIWLGYLAGYFFDVLSFLTKKKFTVSSVRIKKFIATTQFNASKAHTSGFKAPYTLEEGLDKTLIYEFVQKRNHHEKVFFTE